MKRIVGRAIRAPHPDLEAVEAAIRVAALAAGARSSAGRVSGGDRMRKASGTSGVFLWNPDEQSRGGLQGVGHDAGYGALCAVGI